MTNLKDYRKKLDIFLSSKGRLTLKIKKSKELEAVFNSFSLEDLKYLLVTMTTEFEHKKRVLNMISITFFISSITFVLSLSKLLIQSYSMQMQTVTSLSDEKSLQIVLWFLLFLLCVILLLLIVWIMSVLYDIKMMEWRINLLQLHIKKYRSE